MPPVRPPRPQLLEATNGQSGIAKLSDVTGGESFFLGLQQPVSFAPYLDQLQNILNNQYLLSFSAQPGKKAQLQNVSINTEVAGVELASADAVWVPVRSNRGHFTVEGLRIQRGPRQSTAVLTQRFQLIKHEISFLVTSERASSMKE